MPKIKDRTGIRYGRLVAIRSVPAPEEYSNKTAYWECLCDCGKTVSVQGASLSSGCTKSCGCSKLVNKHLWTRKKGKSFSETGNLQLLYNSYKNNAKQRNKIFCLSLEEFEVLTSSDCYYCGTPPNKAFRNRSSNESATPYVYNGIDRKDNELGYTPKNCLPCCKVCNIAKREMPFEDFLVWLDKVAQFQTRVSIEIL